MAQARGNAKDMAGRIEHNWFWFLILGIVLIIGGAVLIAAPHASSIAVVFVIAAVLIIGGVLQIYQAFKAQGWSGFLWSLIVGLVAVVGGIAIYVNPYIGAFAATLVVAAVFIAQGVSQLMLAFNVRPGEGWAWVAIAGAVSIVAGVMIWAELPFSAGWVLGLIAGISVMLNGWSYIALALAAREANSA